MAKIYSLVCICLLLTACSKDVFKDYNRRIVGTWRLADVDRRGLGGDIDHLAFTEGQFTFEDDGGLVYRTIDGVEYSGSWNIRKEWLPQNDQRVNSLLVSAINFNQQDLKTEYFDEMVFSGTNYFKAFIYSGLHTYVFHFRR